MYRFKFVITLLSLFLANMAAQAAIVSGCIIDPKQNPVEYATVIFLHEGKQMGGTTSNDLGCFSQEIDNGTYELRVSFVGLDTYNATITVNGNTNLGKITLKEASTKLKEITVTASPIRREADRFVMNLEGQPMTIGKDGEELLKQAPGVWIDQNDNISINGNGGTKVYINDREQEMSSTQLLNFLRTMRAEDVSKLIVIPHSGAEYSANSSGGIIKIYLKTKRIDGLMGNVGATILGGKYNFGYGPYSSLNVKRGKLSLNAHAWLSSRPICKIYSNETTNYYNPKSIVASNDKSNQNNNTYVGGTLGGMYDIDNNNTIGMEGQFTVNHNPENLYTTSTFSQNNVSTITKSIYDKTQNGYDLNLKLNYIHKIDSVGSTFKSVITYTYDHGKSMSDNASTVTVPGIQPIDSLYNNNSKSRYNVLNWGLDYDKLIGKYWEIATGAKYTFNNMNNFSDFNYYKGGMWNPLDKYNYDISYNEHIAAAYFIAEARYNRWDIKGGARGEFTHTSGSGNFQGQNYFNLFPDVAINYNLTKRGDYSIGLSYNRIIERPSFWSLNPVRYQISDYSYQTGNPLLKSSYNNQIELNLNLAYRYNIEMGTVLSNDGINMQMKTDPIDSRYFYYTWVNQTKVRLYYLSVYAPIAATKWLNITPNITYAIRGEKITSETLNYSYHHILTANCDVTVALPHHIYLETSVNYNKKHTSGNITECSKLFWNASIKKIFGAHKWTASLGVNNILGYTNKGYAKDINFDRSYNQIQGYAQVKASITYNFNSGKRFNTRQIETQEDASRLKKDSAVK